jgi:hypothetical protein
MPIITTLYIYTSKDVIIHSYFSNTKGFKEEESSRNTAISSSISEISNYSSGIRFAARDAGEF